VAICVPALINLVYYILDMDYSGLKRPVSLPMEKEAVSGTAVKEEVKGDAVKARLEQLGY